MRNELVKITTNTGAQLIGKAVSAATTFITIALINRKFGGELLGDFYLMTGFAAYFYLLTDFGINAVATREISKDKNWLTKTDSVKKLFNNLLTMRLAGSLLLVVILCLSVPFIPFKLRNLDLVRVGIVVGLLTIVSQAVYNCATVVFQSSLSYQKLVAASVVGNLFFVFLVFLFVFKGYGVLSLVTANTLGMVVVAGVSFFLAYKSIGSFSFEFDLALWKSLIVSSLPLGIGILLTVVVAKADQFLLSVTALSPRLNLTNDLALGNYGTAYKIFENILVFPTYFVNAVFPILVKNREHDMVKHRQVFWTSFYFMLGFSFLVMLFGWYLAPLAIEFIGGTSLALSTQALRVLLLSLPLFFTSALFLFLMIAQNQQKKVPFIYLAAAIFNVALNLAYIPEYGFMASAWITGATEFMVFVLLAFFGLKSLLNPPLPKPGIGRG